MFGRRAAATEDRIWEPVGVDLEYEIITGLPQIWRRLNWLGAIDGNELWGYHKCQEFLDLLSDFGKLCFSDYAAKCNTTTGDCGEVLLDDETPCPPDSVPSDPSVPGSPCECTPARCIQPVCRFGSTSELRRMGTKTPGDCCDVYECVQPKGNLYFTFETVGPERYFPTNHMTIAQGQQQFITVSFVLIAMEKVRKAPSVLRNSQLTTPICRLVV